jgi:hypothetical protein
MIEKELITNNEVKWILDVLRHRQPMFPDAVDVQELVEVAIKNGVAAILFQAIADQQVACPEELKQGLKKAYMSNLLRNTKIESVWQELKQTIEQLGFPYIPLKGIYLSQYVYADPSLRPMSDIDVLMKPDQADTLYVKLLEQGAVSAEPGYVPWQSTTDHHLPGLTYRGVYIELHRGLFPEDATYNLPVHQVWAASVSQHSTQSIHPHMNLIYFCLHLYYTIKRGGLRIGWLYDFVIYSRSYEFTEYKGDFMSTLNELKCTEPVLSLLYACERLFDCTFPFIEHEMRNREIRSIEKRVYYFLNHQGEGGTDYSYEIAIERLKNTKGLVNKLAFIRARVFKAENSDQSTVKRVGLLSRRMLGMLRQKVVSFFRF